MGSWETEFENFFIKNYNGVSPRYLKIYFIFNFEKVIKWDYPNAQMQFFPYVARVFAWVKVWIWEVELPKC